MVIVSRVWDDKKFFMPLLLKRSHFAVGAPSSAALDKPEVELEAYGKSLISSGYTPGQSRVT